MNKLSELTSKIRQWNLMGFSLLPNLQIAIVHNKLFDKQIVQFLKALNCKLLLYYEEKQDIKTNTNKSQNQVIENIIQQKSIEVKYNENQQNNINLSQKEKTQTQVNKKQTKQKQIQQQKQQLLEWDSRLKNKIYAIYLSSENVEAKVHLIIDQQVRGQIMDANLKKIKKVIERLKRNKNLIFLNFNSQIFKFDDFSQHIQKFGLGFKFKQRQIKIDSSFVIGKQKTKQSKKNLYLINEISNSKFNLNKKSQTKPSSIKKHQQKIQLKSLNQEQKFKNIIKQKLECMFSINQINITQSLAQQLHKKYVCIFGIEINRNYLQMRSYLKYLNFELKQYSKLRQLQSSNMSKRDEQRNLTKYALNCHYQTKQYLSGSLMGTFSRVEIEHSKWGWREKFNNYKSKGTQKQNEIQRSDKRSIHWQVMQIMNALWQIEGDALLKQIDKMPISYIEQRYKMLDYQTLGGFMPSSCFQVIFSQPLLKTLNQIIQTLRIIQYKILHKIKKGLQYFFSKTNICYDFSDSQYQQIKKICKQFRKQTQKVIKSQISYISSSSQDYWSYKQVNSALYTPKQQIYIQIKYIGKNYIKKVWENIKQTLPRLVGQNLLKQIVLHFENKSLNSLINIMNEVPIEIVIDGDELIRLQSLRIKQKIVDGLVYFFSSRTNSQTLIKNLNERMEKNWKRTFGNKIQKLNQLEVESNSSQKIGFLVWAFNLINGKNKTKLKKSHSQQKQNKDSSSLQFQEKNNSQNKKLQVRKYAVLSEKNWLLIVNIDKQVEAQKIQKSSQQGFPERLRPSIWFYLGKRQKLNKHTKVQLILKTAQYLQEQQKNQLSQIYKQIEKDVLRTPPPQLFRQGYLKESLTNVLRAYAILDKDLRYTQGMNFIVGIILCVLIHYGVNCDYKQQNIKSKAYFQNLEDKCFLIFFCMMEKKGLRKIMLIQRATITDLCIRLERYIRQRSSKMAQKIQRSGFTIQMIFSGALISGLTTSDIEFNVQKRVVDMLITKQFSILYKIIGQFTVAAEVLCQNLQSENLYFYLKGKFYNEVYKSIGDQGLTRMFQNL